MPPKKSECMVESHANTATTYQVRILPGGGKAVLVNRTERKILRPFGFESGRARGARFRLLRKNKLLVNSDRAASQISPFATTASDNALTLRHAEGLTRRPPLNPGGKTLLQWRSLSSLGEPIFADSPAFSLQNRASNSRLSVSGGKWFTRKTIRVPLVACFGRIRLQLRGWIT